MPALRRLLLPVLIASGLAVAATPSAHAAAPPCAPAQDQTMSSTHFTLTWDDDPLKNDAVTALQAGAVLAGAEKAYAAFQSMGFPTPINVAGKTNIHVVNLTALNLSSYNCPDDINFDSGTIDGSGADYSIAFDVFEEIEYNFGAIDSWLAQGAASWAAWKSLGYPTDSTVDVGPYEMSLDCTASSVTAKTCSTNGYENLGLSRWPFYEYLAERFGTLFIDEVLSDAQSSAPDTLLGLQNALAAHGTTLAAEYGGFARKLLAGGWTALPLNLSAPPITGTPIQAGAATGDIGAQTFGVDHLGTRFVQIDRGDGSASHACYAATLTLTVKLPAGVTSQPVFYWNRAGSSPVDLSVSGGTATATLPWDTCTWRSHGFLALPNTTASLNGALFVVSGHIDVSTTEVTATPPSVPANTYGGATDVGSAQLAPAISIFGPLLLKLPETATQIRLVVEANAQGSVRATLGSLALGQKTIVPGENVLTYPLPPGVLQRVRLTSATSNVLTLSPLSSDGSATGTPRSLKLAVEPVAKPKTKPRAHKHRK